MKAVSRPNRPMPRWLQCTGKEQFDSAVLASKVVRRRMASKRRRDKLDRPLSSYRCHHCGFFHIGGFGK